MAKTNPNGANQHVMDPRQALFLALYLDPKSPTFSNALQSALAAGYEREYAENILNHMPAWLAEKIGKSPMLAKAERNLDQMLDVEVHEVAIGPFGPIIDKKTKKPFMRRNSKVMALKLDVSKFVTERLGRKRYGKEGGDEPPVTTNITQIIINPPAKDVGRKDVTN